ncbi:MAG: hypothetical protein JO057_09715 [Chloroflexi bacterium]|nr:hypothetical protein [Chloroflexota bacterium]
MALGSIRLINGGLALLAPQLLARRIGIDPRTTPAALYVFRMFGIRTVLIAADLLIETGERRDEAIRQAPLIHASDTAAAALAAFTGRMPGSSGLMIVVISAINTALAVYARKGLDESR